jgi:hypothetical protein
MVAFIDDHRWAHGNEPICKVLPIAPLRPTMRMSQSVSIPSRCLLAPSAMPLKDEVRQVFEANFYGSRTSKFF